MNNFHTKSATNLHQEFISSSKLYQSSAILFSFPKQNRFHLIQKQEQQNLNIPMAFSKRATNQGKGLKQMFPQFHIPNAETNPASDRYDIKREFDNYKDEGKTFGLTHSSYEKTYQPYSLGRTIKYDANYTPGPGQYKYERKIGEDRKKITISERFRNSEFDGSKQAPNAYKLKHSQTESDLTKKYTFGYGRKLKITEINDNIIEQDNPGPGSYEFESVFRNKSKNFKLNPALARLKK